MGPMCRDVNPYTMTCHSTWAPCVGTGPMYCDMSQYMVHVVTCHSTCVGFEFAAHVQLETDAIPKVSHTITNTQLCLSYIFGKKGCGCLPQHSL